MQAMFIDVDGTLSSPCYKVNGKFQIGMSDVQWADYCREHGEDTYEWCRPVVQVKEYVMRAKEKGTKLYVLTTSGTQIETAAKRRFLDRYYAGMFDDIYAVEHDDEKVRFILKKAAELGIEPSDCELVEDCENGRQAVEFVQSQEVDVVLTDICMPYMDGMELSRFLHDNYPDIVIVIFSGFGEFEYAKKAIQYGVSEYMLKPVTAMELRNVIGKMKEKVDQQRKEKEKLERLTQTSENYQKNAIVIRSRALQGFVDNIKTRQESLEELAALGIDLEAACYRVAVFDLDLYSDGSQLTAEKRQESALMSFVLFNISDEIISKEKAGVAYQAGNNKVGALFTGNRTREFEQKIMEICRTIQDKLKELMSLDVSIGVGSWARTQQELRLSHELAEKAIEYRYLLGGNLLISMEERPEENRLSIKNLVEKLVAALKAGKKDNAEHILRQCCTKLESKVLGSLRRHRQYGGDNLHTVHLLAITRILYCFSEGFSRRFLLKRSISLRPSSQAILFQQIGFYFIQLIKTAYLS